MRISDWSSDVCSSDLRSRQIRQGICGSGGTCVLTRSRSGQVHRKAKGKSLARVIYAARALADLGRRTDFLLQAEAAAALETVGLIAEAVQILENHPLIGRSAEQDLRELAISRGKPGYVAM